MHLPRNVLKGASEIFSVRTLTQHVSHRGRGPQRRMDAGSSATIFPGMLWSHHDMGGSAMNPILLAVLLVTMVAAEASAQQYLGNWSSNPYAPNSTANQFGAGNPYNPNSVTNPYGRYGNPYTPNSATNPYATQAPRLYDQDGNYRGRLSTNPYDSDSVSNPYGRYGNPYSSDSINNRFGAGNPYSPSSPSNPFGRGLSIFGDDD
jgi:hypothetical protein